MAASLTIPGPMSRLEREQATHPRARVQSSARFCGASIRTGLALVMFTLSTATANETRAETPVSRAASAHFAAGVAYLGGKEPDRFAQAYEEFKAAYSASPSWKILGNLGIVAQELERYGEAREAFEKYLDEGKGEIDAEEAEQVRRDIEHIRRQQATVTLSAKSGPYKVRDTRMTDDGQRIVNQYGPFDGRTALVVRSGKHEFTLERDAVTALSWSVTLLAGDSSSHSFDTNVGVPRGSPTTPTDDSPPHAAAPTPNSPTLAYVLWGTGAAAAVAGTVLFLEARSLQQDADADFDRDCPGGVDNSDPRCLATTPGDAKAATWRTAALVTGVGAAAALVGGTIVYWLGSGANASSKDAAVAGALDVRAWVSPTGIGVNGTF